ncbi:uncharacterized protein LOC143146131 [Ptiloglossa arizonensis]|uniref:uncharacterized protein LOC143146131 n=1 Tax=Ptiloglossa arizonensis TaxID=3350558 RepID=UPI003FA07FB6
MAPVKRRPRERSHRKMNSRRPSIPELVYKFLSLGCGEGRKKSSDATYEYCRFCKHGKRRGEVVNSLDSHGKNMVNKRRDTKKNSRVHRVKRRHTARDQTLSRCTHSRIRGEGVKKMKKYIQKALDFGVESGYLIPKDAEYRILRVSSDLMHDGNYMSKSRNSDRLVSQERDETPRQTPIRFEDYEVQDAKRRKSSHRKRKRSRSNSRRKRKRGKRRRVSPPQIYFPEKYLLACTETTCIEFCKIFRYNSSSMQSGKRISVGVHRWDLREAFRNLFRTAIVCHMVQKIEYKGKFEKSRVVSEGDDVIENEDYELDESGNNAENVNRDDENERSNHSDGEKTVKKTEDGSELSVDEDDTDEEEKKRTEMQSITVDIVILTFLPIYAQWTEVQFI